MANIYKAIIDSSAMKQFNLSRESLEKKQEFLRKVYSAVIPYSLPEVHTVEKWYREKDPTMSLEHFLGIMHGDAFLKVHTEEELLGEALRQEYDAMPASQREKMTFIRIVCRNTIGDKTFFAWYTCPHNQQNYDKVKQMVSETFERDLEEYLVG